MNKLLLLLLALTVLSSCNKDDDNQTLSVDFSITHDTYSDTESPFTTIKIYDEDGNEIDSKINLGGNDPTWNVTLNMPSSGDETDIEIFASIGPSGKTVIANNVSDGANVSWNTVDGFATVSGGGGGSSLLGRWNQLPTACTNTNGDGNYFNFTSESSGLVFQADCNSSCAGGGVTTSFNYSTQNSSVTITPTQVSTYCGQTAPVPAAFTVPYSISGDVLTLDGQEFERN